MDTLNRNSFHTQLIEQFVEHFSAENSKSYKYKTSMEYFYRIKRALHSNTSLKVSHFHLSGSLGKSTALFYKFDVDIIVFIKCGSHDDYLSKRDTFVNQISKIVKSEFIGDCLSNEKVCRTSYQISINGYDFDILPAMCVQKYQPDEERPKIQHDFIVDYIHNFPKPHLLSHNLRTSMAELSDEFVRHQSPFVKNFILLCKHWCRSQIANTAMFYGRSSAVELIAIFVGNKNESKSHRDYMPAFSEFLEMCSNMNTIAIEFPFPPNRHKFNRIGKNIPYIIDPVNPYHNRLHKVRPDILKCFADIAGRSLYNLRDLLNRNSGDTAAVLAAQYDRYFRFSSYIDDYNVIKNNLLNIGHKQDTIINISEDYREDDDGSSLEDVEEFSAEDSLLESEIEEACSLLSCIRKWFC